MSSMKHRGKKSYQNNSTNTRKSSNANNINGYGRYLNASNNDRIFRKELDSASHNQIKINAQIKKIKLPQNYKKNKNFGYGGASYQSSGGHSHSSSSLSSNVIFSFPSSSTNIAIGTGSF